MSILIRPATNAEAWIIAKFNSLMAKETENRELDPVRLLAGVEGLFHDSSRGLYYVAEVDGSVVGQLMLTYEWSDWRNGTFWWIQSVYVEHDNTAAKETYENLGMKKTPYEMYEIDFVL